MYPRRGEVWWVSFDPSIGGEIQKTRPAIVISNDAANNALNRVIVIPITRQVAKVYPGEALIILNGEQRKAMADGARRAQKQRSKTNGGNHHSAILTPVQVEYFWHWGVVG